LPVDGSLDLPDAEVAQPKFEFKALDWNSRIAGQKANSLEFMSSVSNKNQAGFNWTGWRWPIRLFAVLIVLNLIGLTIQAMNMKREARVLNDSLIQTYRDKFPKETVIRDPLAQMKQKLISRKKPQDYRLQMISGDVFTICASLG